MSSPAISVVICFRDWGLDRLSVAIRSHFINAALCDIGIEVILSDYGSKDACEVRRAIEPLGAKVVRTETSGPWSRSASLNAGVQMASGRCVVTTDADIIFGVGTFRGLLERFCERPEALYLVQCRDLSEAFGVGRIATLLEDDWEEGVRQAQESATIRPRWGMGGFAGFSPALFSAINGYDERLNTWGGEDNDFALRARRAGFPSRWLSRSDVSIMHIWHESSRLKAAQTEQGDAAMAENRRIVRSDKSVHRNLPRSLRLRGSPPLISIIIPTYRRAKLLWESVASCLMQTFQDFEILVVENGDSNEAKGVARSFGDSRVRYLYCATPGAAAARNFGLDSAVGRYIVIHDDDDLMVSSRLEDHLSSITPGLHGTYCGWIDFDGESFEVVDKHPGKAFSFEAVLSTGKVLTHGGLMLDRRVFSMFRYEENLSAGIDYGFILLLARNGLQVGHTGTYGILRRFHRTNMTSVKCKEQRTAAHRMASLIKREIGDDVYTDMRSKGRSTKTLACQNESASLAELADWKSDSRFGYRNEILEAMQLGGGSVEGVLECLEQLDASILRHISRRRQLPLRVSGFSNTAKIFMRLRGIYLASHIGARTLVWYES